MSNWKKLWTGRRQEVRCEIGTVSELTQGLIGIYGEPTAPPRNKLLWPWG
jgi:hypothetical protein